MGGPVNRSTTVERYVRHRPFLVANGTHMKAASGRALLGPFLLAALASAERGASCNPISPWQVSLSIPCNYV